MDSASKQPDALAGDLAKAVDDLIAEVKTTAPPEPEASKVAAACASCRGICCKSFALRVPITSEGKPDFAFHTELTPAELAFVQEHFVLTRQHGAEDGRSVRSEYCVKNQPIFELWFTCTAFDEATSRCTKYEQRPPACKKYACTEARVGKSPVTFRANRHEYYRALLLDPGMEQCIESVVKDTSPAHRGPVEIWQEDWKARYDKMYPHQEEVNATPDLSVQLEQSVSRDPVDSPDNVPSV